MKSKMSSRRSAPSAPEGPYEAQDIHCGAAKDARLREVQALPSTISRTPTVERRLSQGPSPGYRRVQDDIRQSQCLYLAAAFVSMA
jgi:hypothetical protein